MVIGHVSVVASLLASLPPVTLLLGPHSVGKWTIAEEAAERNGLVEPMVLRYERLHVDDTREILDFVSRRSPRPKGVIARLDAASDEAVNALLKVLEEPPPRTHFLLSSENEPLLTIVSRAQVYRLGYLLDDEVEQILIDRYSMDPGKAAVLARGANGQVSRALEVRRYEENKGPVLSVLKGAADGNEELFWSAINGKREVTMDDGKRRREDAFGDIQWALLRRWAVEALTGRWRTFTPAESYGLQRDPSAAQRILGLPRVRPHVGVVTALEPIVAEHKRHA